MSAFEIFLIVLACVFGSAMLGIHLQSVLPNHHLSPESRDTVKLATGLTATMAALLLGLLVSSAKNTFDQIDGKLVETAVRIVVLDRTLANYGPETREIRDALKNYYSARVGILASGEISQLEKLGNQKMAKEVEGVWVKLQQLSPGNDSQRQLQAQALETASELLYARWLVLLQKDSRVSIPLLLLLVSWLATIFAAFGLFSPRNKTAIAALFMSALSVSGAIFLTLELNSPLTGLIKVSDTAMYEAIAHLGL